jgi:protein ImuB
VALVKLPDLPLQILLQDRPEFCGRPTAVVAGEGPEARVTHLNRAALAAGLRLGLTHAAARDRLPGLHTGVVEPERVAKLEAELASGLQMLTPKVEPCAHFPSTFFLDPNGMEKLYGGVEDWARVTHAFLRGRGLFGATWVGFHRYRLFAAAGTQLSCRVLSSPAEEQLLSNGADLRALGLPAELCDDLAMLEVHGLGDLLALPAAEFGGRFGPEAARVRTLFADDTQLPLQPLGFAEPTEARFDVTPPDADTHRLLFGIKAALHPLLMGLRERGEHIRALHVRFELDAPQGHASVVAETLEPAAPTGDLMTLMELIRLRLGQVSLPSPVEAVTLRADTERAAAEPLALPGLRPKRDPQAAARALARVRAAYGPRSVVRARVREAHLPEARFVWVPTMEPPTPAASYVQRAGLDLDVDVDVDDKSSAHSLVEQEAAALASVLVRRVLRRPLPLRTQRARLSVVPPHAPDGASPARPPGAAPATGTAKPAGGLPVGPRGERVQRMYGPYRVSGGWWKRTVERDYYYAETDTGGLLWVYWDRPRAAWFLHGTVD